MPEALSVVVPAFNEERRLPRSLPILADFLRRRRPGSEILVVDDGSADATRHVAVGLPEVRVIRFERNHGKGFAVRAGVLAARFDAVLMCDADLSTPIGELERLSPFLAAAPIVIGSRRARGAAVSGLQAAHRVLLGRTFSRLVSTLALPGIQDSQCGFKLFRRDAALALFTPLKTWGFGFDVEILQRARRLRMTVAEVGVRWSEPGGSQLRAWRDAPRMLWELLRLSC